MTTMSQKKKQMRPKHIPQRTCVGCGETKPKGELIRIVRTESGSVAIDPTGRRSGRGVYLCNAKSCWLMGLKKEHLDRALRTRIAAEDRRGLEQYREMLTS